MRSKLALGMVAALAACSGDNGTTNDGGGNDLAMSVDLAMKFPDLAVPRDLTPPPDFSGINCGAQTCSAGNVCCANQNGTTATYSCATSCADAGITITCDGPDNCLSGSANLCCGTLTTNGGTAPFCNIDAVAACADTCTTVIPTSCNQEQGHVRLCHRAADCASDSQNPNCCLFTYNGNNVTFCADSTVKNFAAMCFN
jgi:hypothetical protein